MVATFLFFHFAAFAQTVLVNVTGMNLHIGQKLEARLIDKRTMQEVDRLIKDPIMAPSFSFSLTGEIGHSYILDFYADLNMNGLYDAPQTDHAWRLEANNLTAGNNILNFDHDANFFTDVQWKYNLIFKFQGMNPHIGQRLEVRLRDISQTGKEVGRVVVDAIATPDFTVNLPFLELGHSYLLDFFADLNQNGTYDAPPMDHAWRATLSDVGGDEVMQFDHNTNFTDIGASGLLTVDFSGMNPHLGQMLELRVIDATTHKEIGRIKQMVTVPDFEVAVPGLKPGRIYRVDFFADLNQNGQYDAPPMDHAWREMVTGVTGDQTLSFAHNTNFTDIGWKYNLAFEFSGMNPHLGQMLEIRVRDINLTGKEVGRITVPSIMVPNFTVHLPFLERGHSYILDYFADLSMNGTYDAPPTDHAWRTLFFDAPGDKVLSFNHNTNFTDIGASGLLTVDFAGMNPHIGQLLELRVLESGSGKEIGRIRQMVVVPDFQVEIPGLKPGQEYTMDFYADLNQNGIYDAPPMDHAWRENFTAPAGNMTFSFDHNTNFTDIDWVYQFTLNATEMNPHLGQRFDLRVVNEATGNEIGRFSLPEIMVVDFKVFVPGLRIGQSYNADFFADLNQNGTYDAPPVDHAWRLNFEDDDGDEVLDFPHNTDFTDIEYNITAVREIAALKALNIFPNPFQSALFLGIDLKTPTNLTVQLYNSIGREVGELLRENASAGKNTFEIKGLDKLSSGLYFLKLQSEDGGISTVPLVKR